MDLAPSYSLYTSTVIIRGCYGIFAYRNAAKAVILHLQSEENDNKWEQTMKVFDENTKEHTPMRMLIEHMPGMHTIAISNIHNVEN